MTRVYNNLLFTGGDKFTNLNIFSHFLTKDDSSALTGGCQCGQPGDHLAWEDTQLTVRGRQHIVQTQVDKEDLCNFNPMSR